MKKYKEIENMKEDVVYIRSLSGFSVIEVQAKSMGTKYGVSLDCNSHINLGEAVEAVRNSIDLGKGKPLGKSCYQVIYL